MKQTTRLAAACSLLGIFLALTAAERLAAAEAPRPNIVLLMADDLGYGDVAYNGNASVQTRVLDEMARTALRLDRYYAAHPVCSPTRGSVMTGRHPNRFGCFSWGYPLRPQETTLAEAFKGTDEATAVATLRHSIADHGTVVVADRF